MPDLRTCGDCVPAATAYLRQLRESRLRIRWRGIHPGTRPSSHSYSREGGVHQEHSQLSVGSVGSVDSRVRRSAPSESRRRGVRLSLGAGGAAGAAVLSVWFYFLDLHANAAVVNSDGATVVLEARAIASGNVLLHGWILSLDSWWTLDAAWNALAVALAGVTPVLLLAVPAVVCALTVVAGAALASDGYPRRAAIPAAIAVVALLALPPHAMVAMWLVNPSHQSTALVALIAFAAASRGRWGWAWVVAVVALAVGLLGDLETVAYSVVPVALAGVVAMARRRRWAAGAPAVSAAAASVVVAVAVREVSDRLGAFAVGPTNQHASLHQLGLNARDLPGGLAQLLGVGTSAFGAGGVPPWLEAFHFVGLAVAGASAIAATILLVAGVLRGPRVNRTSLEGPAASGAAHAAPAAPAGSGTGAERWRLDDMLLIATTGPMVTYLVQALFVSPAYLRYLTASVVFAAVLAGRMVGRCCDGGRRLPVGQRWSSSRRRGVRSPAAVAAAVVAAAVVVAAFAAGSAVQAVQPASAQTAATLARFLEAHHLHSGVGDYWSASITTVESSGRVKVRPVVAAPDGRLAAYDKGAQRRWLAGVPVRFVVFTAPVGYAGVSAASATATWGPPARSYSVGVYRVLVWSHSHHVHLFEPIRAYPPPG